MKILRTIIVIIVIVLIGIQFIPTKLNQSSEVFQTDFMRIFDTPENVSEMIKTSCYDCHSNNTEYPWYNKIQPISWIMENHINDAKKELNLSEFGAYSKRKQRSKLKSIISQIKDDEMPLPSYTLIHWNARLSEEEKTKLVDWLQHLKKKL